MTQVTDQQRAVVRERASAKLQAFADGLTEDERLVLEAGLRRLVAGEELDTQGYRIREERPVVRKPPITQGGGGFLLPSIWLDTIYDPDDGSTSPLNPPG